MSQAFFRDEEDYREAKYMAVMEQTSADDNDPPEPIRCVEYGCSRICSPTGDLCWQHSEIPPEECGECELSTCIGCRVNDQMERGLI
jgi:hypothetical protein